MLTPEFRTSANADISRRLTRLLEEPTEVSVDQMQVGTNPGAVEQAELNRARAAEQAAATERQIAGLTGQLALVAGVSQDAVTIDRGNRRAMVTAKALDRLGLAGYRTLEQRVAQGVPGWTVQLRPPLMPLPDISLEEGAPDESGAAAVNLLIWAGQRTGTAIALDGPEEAVKAVAVTLKAANVTVVERYDRRATQISTSWTVASQ